MQMIEANVVTQRNSSDPYSSNKVKTKRDVVLVVDDTPDTLSMLNDTLDEAGLTVLVALEGNQALNIARSITPDVILMDAIMPHMDGFEACRRIKADRDLAHIPVIFMTGLSDSDSIVKGFSAGGVDYVTKPVNGVELIARLRTHLANARLTQSAHSALDNAGHYLLACDNGGHLRWATPQARQLFERAGCDQGWLANDLPKHVQIMLGPRFSKEKMLQVSSERVPPQALGLSYLGQTGTNEFLLQLIDLDGPSEAELLRQALSLTLREADVLLWIARGKTNREIGTILSLSPRTVNKHLEQIFRKLLVDNRTAAAVIALKHLRAL